MGMCHSYLYMYESMRMCRVCVHVYMCIWRPKFDVGYHPLIALPLFALKQDLSIKPRVIHLVSLDSML